MNPTIPSSPSTNNRLQISIAMSDIENLADKVRWHDGDNGEVRELQGRPRR
jgi:hypothetical protein